MTERSLHRTLSAVVPDQPLTTEVEQHLLECAQSDEERAELRLVVHAVRQVPSHRLPRSFAIDDLMLHRYRRRQRNTVVSWSLRSVVAAAAVLFLAVGVGDIRQSMETSVPTYAAEAAVVPAAAVNVAQPAQDLRPVADVTPAPAVPVPVFRGLEVALAGVAGAAGLALWRVSRRTE
jgi:hypothetical protein